MLGDCTTAYRASAPTSFHGIVSSTPQVLVPTIHVYLEEMGIFLQRDVVDKRRATPGHGIANKSDPVGYSAYAVCKRFTEEVFGGKGTGNIRTIQEVIRKK